MNKPIESKEANEQIIKAIEYAIAEFTEHESLGKPIPVFRQVIENVTMISIFELYKIVRCMDKRLLMPHELDGDQFVLIFKPFNNCTIVVESEPIEKVNYKFNLN